MKSLLSNLFVLFVILLFTYPVFYYTYKYLDPYLISNDLDHYLGMYQNFNLKGTESPFNTRLISSFLVFTLSKLNFYYHTEMVFQSEIVSLNIYFSAFLASYLFFILTLFVVFKLFYRLSENIAVTGAMVFIYFVSFGNFIYSFTPLTDSCGYFLASLAIYAYVFKSRWIWPILALAIIQREYILLGFGLISLYDYFFSIDYKKYNLTTLIICIFSFSVYIALRKIFLYSPKYDSQLEVSEFLSRLFTSKTNWLDFLKQNFLTQNTLFLYFLLVLYKRVRGFSINLKEFTLTNLLLAQVLVFCLVGHLGNNGGRYFHVFTPLLVYYLYKEFSTLPKSLRQSNDIQPHLLS